MKKWLPKIAWVLMGAMLIQPIGVNAEESESIIIEEVNEVIGTEESVVETETETESIISESFTETEEIETDAAEFVRKEAIETEPVNQTEILREPETEEFVSSFESAEGCITVEVSGTRHYDYSKRALDLINEERENMGWEPVKMNPRLLDEAMQRATELTLRDDNRRRPNDTCAEYECMIKAIHGFCGLGEENYPWIYYGNPIWKQDYKYAGIGCIENNGIYYWFVCFSSDNLGEDITKTGAEYGHWPVEIKEANHTYMRNTISDSLTLMQNESIELRVYHYYNAQNGAEPKYMALMDSGQLTWTSSDKNVANVLNGKVTAKEKGETTITAAYKGKAVCQWQVICQERTMVSNPKVTYNGPKTDPVLSCPKDYQRYFIVEYDGVQLTDDDWTITEYYAGDNKTLREFDLLFIGKYQGSYRYIIQTPVEAFVSRLYKEILGRDADSAGLEAWSSVLESGQEQGAKVAQGFVDSDELKKRNLSDDAYICALYRTFFDREADSSGLAAWKKVLDSGLSRMHVFRGFAESDEFTEICDRYGIVRGFADLTAPRDQNEGVTKYIVRSYQLCLNRKADESGLNNWCDAILSGRNTAKEAAHGFVFSQEFLKKNLSDEEYIRVLYRVFMDREADGAGLAAWKKVLKEGKNREHVFNGFADSVEFRDICADYGVQ